MARHKKTDAPVLRINEDDKVYCGECGAFCGLIRGGEYPMPGGCTQAKTCAAMYALDSHIRLRRRDSFAGEHLTPRQAMKKHG